jgi:hypothetical protein
LKSGVAAWNKDSHSKIRIFQTHNTWNKGLPCSQVTKGKISQTLTQKYKEGIHKPWNKGMKIKQQRQSQKVKEVITDPSLTSYPIQEQLELQILL